MDIEPSARQASLPLATAPTVDTVIAVQHCPRANMIWTIPWHQWWMHVYRYQASVEIDDQPAVLMPGDLTLLGPGTRIRYEFPENAVHTVVHFKPGANAQGKAYAASTIYRLGDDYTRVSKRLEEIADRHQRDPLWADATLWELLLSIVNSSAAAPPDAPAMHPAVQFVVFVVNHQMAVPIQARKLAEMAGISLNHLNRLFNASFGMSVMEYARRQRGATARKLLAESDLPMATIAQMVGVPQARQFNRLVHGTAGMSPTAVRREAPP